MGEERIEFVRLTEVPLPSVVELADAGQLAPSRHDARGVRHEGNAGIGLISRDLLRWS